MWLGAGNAVHSMRYELVDTKYEIVAVTAYV